MLYRIVTLTALALGGALLAKQMKQSRGVQSPSSVEEDIDVNVPVRVAYDQFTQFEEFPRFMDSVHEVKQLDDKRLHWHASIAGKDIEWDAEITEQVPDKRIAWRSTSGTPNGGSVTFRSLSRSRTRITLEMYYEPQNGIEMVGDALGAVRATARGNLKNFKEMIELRGQETGAWRGTIAPQPEAGTSH
ncbi:SRPBCC family protein [Massilia sp. TWP1-3-3]|uniref:SRPBCC family protein n=1 Tax=Massilia sp. TWP1-3-3 TaxID=2804573 RepID=UPI003CF68254